jgi:Mn2+/Fe2+ NRAMP family transporter
MALGDYSHTIIVMIIILYFMFNVYATNDLIGSPERMYELLNHASKVRPVAGNTDGSYLTLKSNGGLIFAVVQLCSGMGTVFLGKFNLQTIVGGLCIVSSDGYIRSRVLAACHCLASEDSGSRVHSRRFRLVRHPFRLCHDTWPRRGRLD